ncbi:MAG: MFS transporter [Oscillospiraceae bacterium]|nr:MFS transporter [Oscillospiraceae bacterium]
MEQKREIRYFAAIQLLMSGAGSFWAYSTNFFRESGFSGSQIGLINAICTFVAMLILPAAGILCDKMGTPRRVLFLSMLLEVFPCAALAVFGVFSWVPYVLCVLMTMLVVIAQRISGVSMNSWAGGELSRMGVSFGNVMYAGSAGYILCSVLGSVLIGRVLPVWSCFLLQTAAILPMLLIIRSHRGDAYEAPAQAAVKKASGLLRLVLKNYYFLCYLMLHMAFGLFLGIIGLDLSYLVEQVGAPLSAVGIVGSCRAGTEVVVMVLMSRRRRLPPYWVLLTVSGVLIALEHLLYPFADNVFHLCLITVFCSGLSGGFFYGLGTSYTFQIVDHRAGGTAMSVLGLANAIVGVLGSGLGGMIIDRFGVLTLTTSVGILAMLLTLLFLLSCILGRFVLKKPYVSET